MTPEDEHQRRNQHAPKTPAELATAARALAAEGYSDHTIGAILKMDTNAARAMIGCIGCDE